MNAKRKNTVSNRLGMSVSRHFIIMFIFIEVIFPAILFAGNGEIDKYLSNLPFTMPELKEPVFSDKSFNIKDFGAVNDGRTLNTEAFAKAIKECSSAGGGKIIVPPGTWLTGSIKLESNIRLHLERGALVQFSKRIEDFPLIAGFDGKSKKFIISPLLYAFRATNIAITGEGVFDGNGQAWRYVKKDKLTAQQWKELTGSGGVVSSDGDQWWPSQEAMDGEAYLKNIEKSGKVLTAEDYAKAREYMRPDMVRLVQCTGILLDGITVQNSPRFHVHLVQSENIIVRNVNIFTEWYAQNGDGLDLSASRNILVYKTTVNVGDDAICVKPGNISDRQTPGPACENIVIADCMVYHGHGGFVIGSESLGGARNIYVTNCIFSGTDVGLRFKSVRGRGGLIEKIYIDNIQMRAIEREAILFDMYYEQGNPELLATEQSDSKTIEPVNEKTPRFQNFSIKNIVCTEAGRAILMNGLPEMPVKDITIENAIIFAKKGILFLDTDGINISKSSILTEKGTIVVLKQSQNMRLNSIGFSPNMDTFMSVNGDKSKNILLSDIDLSGVKEKVRFENNADKESVIIK